MSWPIYPQAGRFENHVVVASTTASSADTKNSWTEITSATSEDWAGFYIVQRIWLGLSEIAFWDFAVGAGGSEVPIITNWSVFKFNDGFHSTYGPFWIPIPAGTRLSARNQVSSTPSSSNAAVGIRGIVGADFKAPRWSGLFSIGEDLANTQAVASLSTAGTWVEMEDSLAEDIAGFFVHFDSRGTNPDDASHRVEIGKGAGGSEVAISPEIEISAHNGYGIRENVNGPFWYPVSAGTRLACRSLVTAQASAIGVQLSGIRL